MWSALIHLLNEASSDPSDTHGWTDEERALARDAVAWYQAMLPASSTGPGGEVPAGADGEGEVQLARRTMRR